MPKENPESRPNTPHDKIQNLQQAKTSWPFETTNTYNLTTLVNAFNSTKWFEGKLERYNKKPEPTTVYDTSTSNPDIEKKIHLARQDKIYDDLGVRDITHTDRDEAFIFTNENVTDIIGPLEIEDKELLVIGGSADFIINAFMQRGKSVTAVDRSPIACFVGELKLAALSELDLRDFLKFFNIKTHESQAFSYDIYHRFKQKISKHAQDYFDQLIKPDNSNQSKLLMLSRNEEYSDSLNFNEINPYLQSEKNYNDAKQKLKPVIFYPQTMQNFLDQNKDKHDLIYLSNMLVYKPYMQITKNKVSLNEDEIANIIQSANKALNANGSVVSYVHSREPKGGKNFNTCRNINREITKIFNGTRENESEKMKGITISGKHSESSTEYIEYSALILKKVNN